LLVTGYCKIPADGIYRLIVRSDDGSRVLLNNQLMIDNDGNHPPKQASKRVRLKAGFHSLRVEYFEGNGAQALQLAIEMPDGTGREVTSDMLFH
jgi:PA14 domain